MRKISETSKSYLGMSEHLVIFCNFFFYIKVFPRWDLLLGTLWVLSFFWLFSCFSSTNHIHQQCCFPSLPVLTRNSKQPLLQWSLLVKSPRTKQTSISNHKPWSPIARRKPEESNLTIWRPKGQTFTSDPLIRTHFQFMSNLFLKKHFCVVFHGSGGKLPRFSLNIEL